MMYIYVILPFAAIWLMSAYEHGLLGAWAFPVSLIIMLIWGVMCEALGDKNKGKEPVKGKDTKIKKCPSVVTHRTGQKQKIA